MAQFEPIAEGKVSDVFGQVLYARHLRTLHEHRCDRDIPFKRGFDLQAHEIGRVLERLPDASLELTQSLQSAPA